MFRIVATIIISLIVTVEFCFAQGINTPIANGSIQFNASVGATPVAIIPFNPGTLDWTIHPENGNIRCLTQIKGITNAPTSTVGFELTSGGYFNNFPFTPAYLEQDCVAESGTVKVSGWYDVQ